MSRTPPDSLFHPGAPPLLLTRLRDVSPGSRGLWGRMTPNQMLCHLGDSFEVSLGDRPCESIATPLSRTVVKWVALRAPVPWPKGLVTLREVNQELDGTPPAGFDGDRARLEQLIHRFAKAADELDGRPHPLFGRMSRWEWGRWGYRHLDHHLRQFGA